MYHHHMKWFCIWTYAHGGVVVRKFAICLLCGNTIVVTSAVSNLIPTFHSSVQYFMFMTIEPDA
jgi:hypothetical protein